MLYIWVVILTPRPLVHIGSPYDVVQAMDFVFDVFTTGILLEGRPTRKMHQMSNYCGLNT